MWIVIIAIAVIGIIYALGYSAHKSDINNKINSEGGILKKYERLIENLKKEDPNSRIYKVSSSSVTLGVKKFEASVLFTITQDVNTVLVSYRLNNKINNSRRELNWEFPENLDQNEIFNKIRTDVILDTCKLWSGH